MLDHSCIRIAAAIAAMLLLIDGRPVARDYVIKMIEQLQHSEAIR